MTTEAIFIQHAYVYLQNTAVLHNINLQINALQHTAILGANGSGKTTLMRLIMNDSLYPAAFEPAPEVRIFGESFPTQKSLRKQIGIVSGKFSEDMLNSYADTVFEAVASACKGTHGFFFNSDLTAAEKRATEEAIERCSLNDLAGRALHTLSTGQLRQVIIARALMHKPRLLLLDEPTAGLDLPNQQLFFNTVQALTSSVTILLITHHIEEIFPAIENVVLMKHGRILRSGKKNSMLTNENLSETFSSPIRVSPHQNGTYSAYLA